MTENPYPTIPDGPNRLEMMAGNLRTVRAALRVACPVHGKAIGAPCWPPREDFANGWCCDARRDLDAEVERAAEDDERHAPRRRKTPEGTGEQVRTENRRQVHRQAVRLMAAALDREEASES